jgi:hypothetical protein
VVEQLVVVEDDGLRMRNISMVRHRRALERFQDSGPEPLSAP